MENKNNISKKDDKIDEKEYRKLQIRLDEWKKTRKKYFILFVIIIVIINIISWSLAMNNNPKQSVIDLAKGNTFGKIIFILWGVLFTIMIILYLSLFCDLKEKKLKQRILAYELDNMWNKVEEDIFENSVKMSYKYLDQYYSQTKKQAEKGFYITVAISIFGALLIGVGVTVMFIGKTEPSYVTCASGVITEFISAVFFYLYNKTITSMKNYHNKLVLSHNISIALKVSDSLPNNEKIKTKNMIITELLKDINSYLVENDNK